MRCARIATLTRAAWLQARGTLTFCVDLDYVGDTADGLARTDDLESRSGAMRRVGIIEEYNWFL